MTFNPAEQNLDYEWLANNGWTTGGNLAYQHLLYEFNRGEVLPVKRIEEIAKQYDAYDQLPRLRLALKELIELKRSIWDSESSSCKLANLD